MFLDASAIVAILLRLPGHEAILDELEKHDGAVFTSALVRFETVAMILHATSQELTEDDARDVERVIDDLLKILGARDIPITSQIGSAALDGFSAGLGIGDCFALACAKAYRLKHLQA